MILDARARSRSSAPSRPPTAAPRRSPRATFSGPRPPASITRPVVGARALEVRRVALLPRQVDDRRRPARRRGAATPSRARCPSSRVVELHEVGVRLLLARRRRPRRAARSRARRAARRCARGLSCARMKPTRSAPASTAASTSSWRVSPQTLTSGRESSSRSFAPGSARAHQRRADEHRVRAGELGRGALGARAAIAALGDHDPVARRAREQLELRARGRSRRSRGRAR